MRIIYEDATLKDRVKAAFDQLVLIAAAAQGVDSEAACEVLAAIAKSADEAASALHPLSTDRMPTDVAGWQPKIGA